MPLRTSTQALPPATLPLFGLCLGLLSLAAPGTGRAGAYSLVGNGVFLHQASTPSPGADAPAAGTRTPGALAQPNTSLLPDTVPGAGTGRGAVALRPGANSLFRGRGSGGLFARAPAAPADAQQLMTLIASAEAGHAGYDAVQYGATRRPARKPTEMTIGEIYAWIDATPGQPHAIGRYQLIPATLRRLVRHQGVSRGARFTPQLQDQLAHQLLEEAGYSDFLQGDMGRKTFMHNLAKIWAGLPTSSGKSYYHGYAGNQATLTWARFDAEMKRIFSG
ncbi:hypothetical protein [Cribrihabitans neustonicus]|uniref:hypothetical protein n=1 Tax=Cribrihabitans neustonicus TaxID=1429085 RepID=UPI003B58CA24